MADDPQLVAQLKEHFGKLPKVVQDAITSADVAKHMRKLANAHKLHVDQWEALETVVQLTLLAIHPIEDLEKNIQKEVGVPESEARALAEDIGKIVFEPIRQQLERELSHPEAKSETVSALEAARRNELSQERGEAVTESTPSAQEPQKPLSPTTPTPSYHSNTASHERSGIEDDPYREQIA